MTTHADELDMWQQQIQNESKTTSTQASASTHGDQLKCEARFQKQHPLADAMDGDVKTWAWPEPKKVTGSDEPLSYEIVFAETREVDRLRFWQHPWCYATEFRILADESGNGQYDKVLLEVHDPRLGAGEWVRYDFEPITAHGVKFEAIRGCGQGMSFPALAEIQVLNSRQATSESPSDTEVLIRVAIDSRLDINGFTAIQPEMFNLCWGATGLRDERPYDLLKPLNLGGLTTWGQMWGDRPLSPEDPPRAGCAVFPEDPDHPGQFDRNEFTSGAFREWLESHSIGIYRLAHSLGANVSEMLGKAPSYMQRTDFKSTADGNYKNETQFFPPKDPAEWGRLVGHVLKDINDATDGAVKRGYIWNEPNASRYFPVPWDDKADTYCELFLNAVPEIKALNPDIMIGGPVVTGSGPLAWGNGYSGWNTWAKRFIDRCGELADFYDAHSYYCGPDNLYAETDLIAGYSLLKTGKILPLTSTEAAPHLGKAGAPYIDEIGVSWRNGAVPTASMLLHLITMPDKWIGYSRFYYKSFPGLSVFNDKYEPEPIYWAYWVMRNLRGELVPVECSDSDVLVVATHNEKSFVVTVQNLAFETRYLTLDMRVSGTANVDYLEYNPDSGEVEHGTRNADMQGENVSLELAPMGLYTITMDVSAASPVTRTLVREDFHGDQFFQRLTPDNAVEMVIDLPTALAPTKAWLRFGSAGSGHLTEDRPRVTFDYRIPLIIEVNGRTYHVEAGKWNSVPLEADQTKGEVQVRFRLDSSGLDHLPKDFWIMSASVATEMWESQDIPAKE
ncbi:MAG: hypothetical protein Q7Q73_08475 [Verrucomicrobiota bacterium JB024]|nr:hypothetical protein [Verrucomicrobiota bacterium JB024]